MKEDSKRRVAVILAGGKGTRLRPYTLALPKPLVTVGDQPILEIVIKQLVKYGFTEIFMAVNHQADLLKAYFGEGERFDGAVSIKYFLESKPLGTMGPLKAMGDLPDNFLVLNADVLTDLDFSAFLDHHIDNKSIFTISCFKRIQKVDYGVLEVKDSVLTDFTEKPSLEYCVSMGVYAANKQILTYIPQNDFFGFDQLVNKMLDSGARIDTELHEGYWLDIGRPEDYVQANDDWENGKINWRG